VDPYNRILKIRSGASYKTKCPVLGGRVCGRAVSTVIVCSVAKCKYLFRMQVLNLQTLGGVMTQTLNITTLSITTYTITTLNIKDTQHYAIGCYSEYCYTEWRVFIVMLVNVRLNEDMPSVTATI
jgi:hypothetical protein